MVNVSLMPGMYLRVILPKCTHFGRIRLVSRLKSPVRLPKENVNDTI